MFCLCGLLAFFLILNYLTETIPVCFSSGQPSNGDFSVMCYNVRCSDDNYDKTQIGIAKEIIAESPDIVILCEFNRSVSKDLDLMMIQQGEYKSFYRSGANCIFYSKFEIDSIASIDVGTSKGKTAINNKVHVYSPYGIITIVGCHLSSSRKDFWGGKSNRERESDSIFMNIKEEQRPLIVMGDMNDVSGSYPINRIKEAGLKDAWWEGGCGYGTTFHSGLLRLRIDHILYDEELELAGVKVIDNDLSDHNALIAKFKMKKLNYNNYNTIK